MPLKLSCMSVHVLYDSALNISGTVLVLSAPLLFLLLLLLLVGGCICGFLGGIFRRVCRFLFLLRC